MLHEKSPQQPDNFPEVSELHRRNSDGIEVVLWWVKGTMSTYVQVADSKEGQNFIVETPEGGNALDVFKHPFAYRAAAKESLDGRGTE